MVSEREIESDRMFNQMLLTDAEKAFMDRVWPKLQNGCYRTHGSNPVEIRGLDFNEFVRDGLCAVLEATAPQPSGKIEEAAQIIQAFIDQEVDYIMRNNRVEEALHHLKIIEGEANRVTNPVTKNNLLYEIERIRSALTASKLEQKATSGKVDARIENTDGKKWRVESNDGKWTIQPEGRITADEARALCKRILSALTAGKQEQSGWRPIETAPKDGTWILVWEDAALAPRMHVVRLGTSEWGGDRETWVTMALGPNPDTYDADDATHWMPLPTSPTAGGGE